MLNKKKHRLHDASIMVLQELYITLQILYLLKTSLRQLGTSAALATEFRK